MGENVGGSAHSVWPEQSRRAVPESPGRITVQLSDRVPLDERCGYHPVVAPGAVAGGWGIRPGLTLFRDEIRLG